MGGGGGKELMGGFLSVSPRLIGIHLGFIKVILPGPPFKTTMYYVLKTLRMTLFTEQNLDLCFHLEFYT